MRNRNLGVGGFDSPESISPSSCDASPQAKLCGDASRYAKYVQLGSLITSIILRGVRCNMACNELSSSGLQNSLCTLKWTHDTCECVVSSFKFVELSSFHLKFDCVMSSFNFDELTTHMSSIKLEKVLKKIKKNLPVSEKASKNFQLAEKFNSLFL